MANPTGPFGLKPVRRLNGSPLNLALVDGYCSSNYATALFIGDPALLTPTSGDKETAGKHPTINTHAGTSGLLIPYVITGFDADPTNLERKHNPASTEREFAKLVRCDDDLVFHIRDNGDGTPASTWPGKNAEMVAGSGGSTVTGLSSFALDATTPTTTQAFPLHILGLANIENNELGDYAIWEVVINTNNNSTGRILGINV